MLFKEMSETPQCEDEVGKVLVQVQYDLRQLKRSLDKLTVNASRETLDVQALDTAISRTEGCIMKHTEQYLRIVNNQLQALPCIEGIINKKPKNPEWQPVLENIPHIEHQKEDLSRVSPGDKHKNTITMRLLCNHLHPKNSDIMHPKFAIPLPDMHKINRNPATHERVFIGPTVGQWSTVSTNTHSNLNLARTELDIKAGNSNILEKSLPSSVTHSPKKWIQHKAVSLHHKKSCSSQTGSTDRKSGCPRQLKWEKEPERSDREYTPFSTNKAPTPPPSATSQSSDPTSKSPQNLPVPVPISKFPFTIADGQIDPMAVDFCRFKRHYSWCWGTLVGTLEALGRLLREFAVPLATVNGEQLASFAQSSDVVWSRAPPVTALLSVLENREEALGLVSCPGRRYRGEGGTEAAVIRIQSCWRRYLARKAYLRRRRHEWAARTAAIAWLRHAQMGRVQKALQARRFRQLENYRSRAQHLAANWKHIQSSKRTIIHIPSLGYPQCQRLSLKDFDSLQNSQISRLCDIRDKNVQVIYVSPRPLDDDISLYYTSLLDPHGGPEVDEAGLALSSSCSKRFTIITPEAVDYFPTHSMCLSTLLKYSPRALRRIRQLIQGREAYVVGRVAHADDLAVADELGVPVLGPEPAAARLYGSKSGGRRILEGAGVAVTPGQGDIYLLEQLHEALARLMVHNMHVRRWLFKADCEFSGRGTAYCDVRHLSCHSWALQEFHRVGPDLWSTQWAKETVLLRYLDEVPEWLAHHAKPAKTSHYPNWACFLKTFLRQGGVVEAYPPSDRVTCLIVDLLLEPGSEVTMLSCGDQLHSSCRLEALGSSVPQTSVSPDALHSVCARVGRACLQRRIVGYVSLDLATFVDPHTFEQKVWTVDLDLGYSNQLAMTQMLLCLTGGTLDCRTCDLKVPVPVKEKPSTASKPPGAFRYAVMGNHLFHTNLLMVYHSAFLKMCKAQGIGFNRMTKQGTVFALHDSIERHSLGMITISEDLPGALVTFARNLSVIHQEISSPKMQGETNFKDLIKDIKDVLRMTAQKVQVVEDKKSITTT